MYFSWHLLHSLTHWGQLMDTCITGPCITNVIATCRKNFSQWESSFLWKLRCHWLKFLRRVAKTLVIQGPELSHYWFRLWLLCSAIIWTNLLPYCWLNPQGKKFWWNLNQKENEVSPSAKWQPFCRAQWVQTFRPVIDGLLQDCSISTANALEIQSCTKPSI